MSNLAVKYDNKMNLLSFKELEKIEANLFFSIVARLKEKGTESVTLNFSEITEFLDKNLTTKELAKMLDRGVGKIVQTAIRWRIETETERKTIYFTLFNEFEINDINKTLKASISPKFLYILNNFENGNFTMFELAEFSSLSSKYTQTLYRLLKQFRTTGYLTIKWADFIEIMDIPKSYSMGDIDKQILKPSIKELTQEADIFNQSNPIFKKLIYKKIRGKGRGRPVERIEFYFMPEIDNEKEQKRSDRALEIIADEIWSQRELKKLKTNKETIKQQEPQILETRTGIFGNQVSDLTAYINCHFYVKNKFDGGNDTCKIKELYQNQDGTIYGLAINQENNKTFKLNFKSLKHLKNALNL